MVAGLLDEDSELADSLADGVDRLAVNLLGPDQGGVADVFARVAPSPGGTFRTGTWRDAEWGPVLDGAAGWLGIRVTDFDQHLGWTLLVRGEIEHVELTDTQPALGYLRGHYLVP